LIANPVKNRTLSAHATVYVNRYIEQQQQTNFRNQLPGTASMNTTPRMQQPPQQQDNRMPGPFSPSVNNPSRSNASTFNNNSMRVTTVNNPSTSSISASSTPRGIVSPASQQQQRPPHPPASSSTAARNSPMNNNNNTAGVAAAAVDIPTYNAVATRGNQRPVDVSTAAVVSAQLVDQTLATVGDEAPVEAEAFLSEEVIFTVH
jgi:hypothetical protein